MQRVSGLRTLPQRVRVIIGAALLVLAAGLAVWSATSAKPESVIGYVDVNRVAREYLEPTLSEPLRQETERLQAELDQELARLDKQLEDRAKGLGEQERQRLASQIQDEKQQLFMQYQQRLDQRKQEMLDARLPRVRDAIGKVAQRLGLEVVLDKNLVIWGGYDATDEVLRELGVKVAGDASSSGR
ncbi:OmpH family outer membrane protein [Geochorda subterranea]|uniref:OmpH family outer membrane protein n=1 Tax=Geochorda subterranea TaxID=3109564 RepID=A0ABZ1BRL5_9FIRM|nr:OmpH family outer membrane protein [Limnochorda sp. LNt]WRP14848.1 OmpH family outer membrane protein [Limnochorda sp. LNt]